MNKAAWVALLMVVLVVCLAAYAGGQMTGTTRSMPFVQAAEEMAQDVQETASNVRIDPETGDTLVQVFPIALAFIGLQGLALYFGKSNKVIACIIAALVWLLAIGSLMTQ